MSSPTWKMSVKHATKANVLMRQLGQYHRVTHLSSVMHLLQSKEPLSVLGALQNTEVHPAPESMHSQCCSLPVIPIRMTRLLQKHQDKLLAKWASSSYLSSATTICKIRMRSWRLEEKKKSKEPLNLPQLWRSLLRIRTWICERSRVMRLTLFLASWWRSRALKPTKDPTVKVQ